ncbi:MAG TPA: ribbon-helix-helix domain-containing protein [Burkholderiaceae bacterium]|nr:ribbon-helix-helix domain-containing protein [Burkholderiaceae bacterium]
MCQISKSIGSNFFERETRSVRIKGYVTSMGLEEEFWVILKELAEDQGMSVGLLLAVLYGEYMQSGCASNFASFLRVSCVEVVRGQRLVPERIE